MNREGSALRAIGRLHSLPQGSAKVWWMVMTTTGPAASASTSTNPMTSSRLSLLDQAKTASSSRMTSSGMPT
jgi:hypothetical protein